MASTGAGTIPARNDILRRFPPRFVRWREHRQISAISCELGYGDLAIANGGEFATQELDRRAMLRRRTLEIDNADPRAGLQGGREIIEEGIGLAYLVIHVHEDGGIERGRGQAGGVWAPQRQFDVCEL